ncbi:MAG: 23S rRNA (uracil(1939)-C(5))-methyltransferase RlmD, partial [Lachnospiraceae bacterium]|nr:23S rRNA (uracil(1939)-C(5))-methyltransferase RlmD [Lachnospiraceae bacterium]
MKKGTIIEGVVETLDFPNKGVVKTDEGTVIVKGTLPGQTVKAQINKTRSGKCEGRLLEVVKKAPIQSWEPACPHFGECGGCSYQDIPYEEQLKLKAGQVKKLLDNAAKEPYVFEGIMGSPTEFDYRNKMEFSFGDEYKDGPLALGLHKTGSFYDIVNLAGCKIVNEDYNRIIEITLNVAKKYGADYYHKITHKGFLRHLLVRRSFYENSYLVALVTAGDDVESKLSLSERAALIEDFKNELLGTGLERSFAGILHIENSREADVVQADKINVLYGKEYFTEELLGLKFKVSTFSFFQTNTKGAEVLYSLAREYVGDTKDKVIFDLYSGTGTIGQILSPVAKYVVGIELIEEAVDAANENTALNGIKNARFIAGDVFKKLDEVEEKPDIIVLDPPR